MFVSNKNKKQITQTRKTTYKKTHEHTRISTKTKKNNIYNYKLFNNKHKYYIVKCNTANKDDLKTQYLEQHLNNLLIMPDTKAMNDIKNLDENFFTNKLHKPFNTFCTLPCKLPDINNINMTADIFVLDHNMYWNIPRFNNIKKFLVNMLNIKYIMTFFNKFAITNLIMSISPALYKKYIPNTFKINEYDKYKFSDISDNMPITWFILRPIDSFGGDDIKYISNIEELNDAILYYNTTKNYKSQLYKNNVISSVYIHNPLLFNKKKFHLRLYYLVSYTNNILNTFLLDFGKILTAQDPFDMDKPFTKNKHDSHFDSTIKDVFFPDSFKNNNITLSNAGDLPNLSDNVFINKQNLLWQQCRIICSILSKLIENNTYKNNKMLFSNEANGYYIFGIDIMVDNTFTPKLIEINDQPGFTCKYNNGLNILSKNIYKWLNETVLEPLLQYNNPLLARKHKTYIKPY